MASGPARSTVPSDITGHRTDDDDRAHTAPRVMLLLRDALLARAVGVGLREQGFEVETGDPSSRHVDVAVAPTADAPHVVVVDLTPGPIPTGSAVRAATEVLEEALGAWTSPDGTRPCVIAMTPPAGDTVRIEALRAGADDAVSTPITVEELAARCHAVLRRSARPDGPNARSIEIGPLTLDRGRKEIRVDGRNVLVTRIEFALFEQLCLHPDKVRARTTLLHDVWGPHWVGDTHVVDVHLSNLRRKLQRAAPGLSFIHTVRGIGFRLSDDLRSGPARSDQPMSA